MKATGSLKVLSFIYDFAVDGGAQGDHRMGVFLPSKCMVLGSFIQSISDLASAGNAVVVINTVVGATILQGSSGTAGNYNDYNGNTYGFSKQGGGPTINIVSNNGGLVFDSGPSVEICTTIITADLTAGSFKCVILIVEF